MKFGIFYEHQLPRPWEDGDEQRLFHEALDQVELADKLGYDHVWAVEHHFLEEYSHSSAPEVFLGACSQRTKQIRLGHGIVLMPPNYNHPVRVAERIATLDLVSNGRVEFGTGQSASRTELDGFRVALDKKKEQWLECVEQTCNMLAMDPYPGYESEHLSIPCRNVVPKPVQRPHPPLWVACSNYETIKTAARLGMGALTFAFIDPNVAKEWVDEYYRIIREECTPIGHTINANIAIVTGFGVHQQPGEAARRMLEGFDFFRYGLKHYYATGLHSPGRTDVWKAFQSDYEPASDCLSLGIGTPDEVSSLMRDFQDVGIDQVIFIQQGGRNRHDHICEALELFATDVMPKFKENEESRLREKHEELAPYFEEAMRRKKCRMPALKDEEIPPIPALGREIAETTKKSDTAKFEELKERDAA